MARYDELIAASFQVVSSSGDERLCRCPFHDEGKTPHLYANAVKGLYICFSCGAKGTLATLEGRVPDADLYYMKQKIKHLVEKEDVFVPRDESWLLQFDVPTPYWQERGFSDDIIKRFKLGYEPMTNRATIPLRDSWGKLGGVIYRRLDGGKPKYSHPKGFKMGANLFGADQVRAGDYKRVAITEGPLDAVACWDANVPAVALHGCRVSPDQAKLLKQLGVTTAVVMTDNDDAGFELLNTARQDLAGMMVMVGMYRQAWVVPDRNGEWRMAKDPGELTAKRRRHMFLSAVPLHKVLA